MSFIPGFAAFAIESDGDAGPNSDERRLSQAKAMVLSMKEYDAALKFWDDTFLEIAKDENGEDEALGAESLGCKVMEDKLRWLAANSSKLLDLGFGSGWASIFIANAGCEVVGVDQSANAAALAEREASKYGLFGVARFITADESWLLEQPDGEFDGFFSCNLLDVIPTDVSSAMLKQAARVMAHGANIVISLNPYTDEAKKARLKLTEAAPEHFAMDGVLRIVNRSTEEWQSEFEKHFDVVEYKEFNFDKEPDAYIRRMWTMKNR